LRREGQHGRCRWWRGWRGRHAVITAAAAARVDELSAAHGSQQLAAAEGLLARRQAMQPQHVAQV
jgi:dTDP-4-amino-4,6-dideoxygalactose transaminase